MYRISTSLPSVLILALIAGCEDASPPSGQATPPATSQSTDTSSSDNAGVVENPPPNGTVPKTLANSEDSVQQSSTDLQNSIGMKLKLISAGTYTAKNGAKITISKPYFIGVYEVTQAQYEHLMGANPSAFKGERHPVSCVPWDDAVEFCRRLSELPKEKEAGRVYRLPTNAEWEHACRAGTSSTHYFGRGLPDHAWYDQNSGGQTHDVGLKRPNPWGLYDVYGNVAEWCQDFYDPSYPKESTDPKGPSTEVGPKKGKVARGGGHDNIFTYQNSLAYVAFPTDLKGPDGAKLRIGFRVAMDPPGN